MSFEIENFGRLSNSESSQIATIYSYSSSTDDLATVVASAYFNNLIKLASAVRLKIGDLFVIQASDAECALRCVSSVTTNVTLAALS